MEIIYNFRKAHPNILRRLWKDFMFSTHAKGCVFNNMFNVHLEENVLYECEVIIK